MLHHPHQLQEHRDAARAVVRAGNRFDAKRLVRLLVGVRPGVPVRHQHHMDLGVLPVLLADNVVHRDGLLRHRPVMAELLLANVVAIRSHRIGKLFAALGMPVGSRNARTERDLPKQVFPGDVLVEK